MSREIDKSKVAESLAAARVEMLESQTALCVAQENLADAQKRHDASFVIGSDVRGLLNRTTDIVMEEVDAVGYRPVYFDKNFIPELAWLRPGTEITVGPESLLARVLMTNGRAQHPEYRMFTVPEHLYLADDSNIRLAARSLLEHFALAQRSSKESKAVEKIAKDLEDALAERDRADAEVLRLRKLADACR